MREAQPLGNRTEGPARYGACDPLMVHVSRGRTRTPARLSSKARAGLIKQFTGVSHPYEPPGKAEVVIDTTNSTPEEAANQIFVYLEREGFIGGNMG